MLDILQELTDDLSGNLTAHSRSRQMDATKLDTKIVKSLKKQEEKREKRTQRKKEAWETLTLFAPGEELDSKSP